jgi:hypothetical protein
VLASLSFLLRTGSSLQPKCFRKGKSVEKRRVVIGIVSIVIGVFTTPLVQAQQPIPTPNTDNVPNQITNTYAAKFICGVQRDNGITDVPDAQPGRYSSKINVHNNTGVLITFRKKFIRLVGGELFETPMNPKAKVFEKLAEDQAMEVVCRDIYKQLPLTLNPQLPPPYIEGFVILEVYYYPPSTKPPPPDPLDVEGIYTYNGNIPGPTPTNNGVSIAVVVYPAKSNGHVMH